MPRVLYKSPPPPAAGTPVAPQGPVEPTSPSPPTSPSFHQNPPWSDHDDYGQDQDSSDDDYEDPYFNSIVDNATATDLVDDIDYKASNQQQSYEYANSALDHYNKQENNEIKYELI